MKITFKYGRKKHNIVFQTSTSRYTDINILTKNGDEAVIEGIKSHLENKLKTKIDIDYNYQGAGFGFNIDKYSILTKLK
jgi:hypothetical protein